ncbi:MAG: alpha/beta hydrolase [Clostridia bacterium]|nr:alpha/beta hydrolase [Clostridia bacterium]
MKKAKIKNILIGSTIAAAGIAGAAAVSHAITEYLMRVALDRQAPKSMVKSQEKMMGEKQNRELVARIRNAAASLEERVTETAEITAEDGTRLVGHWWPCEKPKRVVIAMHGWRSTWSQDFGIIADFWHDSGCSILFAEQRGQGNSGGDYMGFGLTERFDCRDWVNWVNEKTDMLLPVYLGGVSMGAATILMASGLDMPDNVAGIVADCGFTSPYAIWKHVVQDNFHLSYDGIRSAAATDLCRRKIQTAANSYSTTEALKNTDIPVLFIHGTDDHFVPVEMTYENYKACASEKHLLIVPGAEHAMSYLADKAAYENAIRNFWKLYDYRTELKL